MVTSFRVLTLAVGLSVLSVGLVACGSGDEELVLDMTGTGASQQSGTVTLRATGDQIEVVLELTPGSPENDPQPVHIHFGNCVQLGAIHYPLNDVIEGKSTTIVDTRLSTIRDGEHAINVHNSFTEIRLYSSCGEVPE